MPATAIATADEALALVRRAIDAIGTSEYARRAGVTPAMVSAVYYGERPISDKIADVVGLESVFRSVEGFDASWITRAEDGTRKKRGRPRVEKVA